MEGTAELRGLILGNPGLPLLIFCGEEAWGGEYVYEKADVTKAEIKELTLYGDYWLDREEYVEQLADAMSGREEYKGLPDGEYWQMAEEKAAGAEFVKAIVIYVG